MKMNICIKFGMFALACLAFNEIAVAQDIQDKVKGAKGIEVIYQSSFNGNIVPMQTRMIVIGDRVAFENIRPEFGGMNGGPTPRRDAMMPATQKYIDYAANLYYQYAELPDGQVISSATPFQPGSGFQEAGTDTYLGMECKILKTSVNSNSIEVWCTNDIPFRGTVNNVGIPDGLVLRIIRNGSMIQEAIDITPVETERELFPTSWGEVMDDADFQYAINQSNVTTITVFDQQTLSFSGAKLPEELEDGITYSAGGGTIILKKVSLPDHVNDRNVFAEVVQYSEGDSYDRTGSIFIIPAEKALSFIDAMRDLSSVPAFLSDSVWYHGLVSTDSYDVPVELMRFFTGFGVRKFNDRKVRGQDWVDSVIYKMNITPLAENLQGETWIGAYIGNWDANGHRLSLKLKYYPDMGHRVYNTIPLFNTVNYLEQAGQPYPLFMLHDSLEVKFTLEEPARNACLYYQTSGHGGWGGGDEFTQKPNTIYLDGKKVISFIPWRDDCGTYRNNNPSSGNFFNGLSSSDLSRSNWCPGTVTNPEYIYLGDLDAGEHVLHVQIPQGEANGNGISYWCVSGTIIY